MVTVVIPAAGAGRRMSRPDVPAKQFQHLGGAPVLIQTLRIFEYHPDVHSVVIAAPRASILEIETEIEAYGITKVGAVVEGGSSRQASVGCGLAVVPSDTDIVLVHDAVRPFLSHEELTAVIEGVQHTGVAALAIPVADTLRKVSGEQLGETVPRENLWRMQTPQAAAVELLRQAHKDFGDTEYTDEIALLQRTGQTAHLVRGSTFNFKITTPDDWNLAHVLWPFWQNERGF